mmetsp:Transcript_107551/g.302754  ORF Transcript_107551/g.302754 Transcript_107551/m.302754 type:complete len:238 (-) Transcript_107551:1002-1715(-)
MARQRLRLPPELASVLVQPRRKIGRAEWPWRRLGTASSSIHFRWWVPRFGELRSSTPAMWTALARSSRTFGCDTTLRSPRLRKSSGRFGRCVATWRARGERRNCARRRWSNTVATLLIGRVPLAMRRPTLSRWRAPRVDKSRRTPLCGGRCASKARPRSFVRNETSSWSRFGLLMLGAMVANSKCELCQPRLRTVGSSSASCRRRCCMASEMRRRDWRAWESGRLPLTLRRVTWPTT